MLKRNEDGTEVRVCDHCGKELPNTWEYVVYDEEDWCYDCAEEHLEQCDCCGRYFAISDDLLTDVEVCDSDTQRWCESCTDYYAEEDYYSGDLIARDGAYEIRTGFGEWAYTIRTDDTCYCDHCGYYVDSNFWNDEYECCENCADVVREEENTLIKDYHAHKRSFCTVGKFKGKGSPYFVAIELEIDGGNCSDREACAHAINDAFRDHFVFEYDGSLNSGFEIISQPHTIEEFFALDWKKLFKICKNYGFKSHDAGTCGLHVHITRTFFGANTGEQERAIAKLITFVDKFYNDIVRASRRDAYTARRWAGTYDTLDREDALRKARNEDCERYRCINVTNPNTVEIRIMRGTLLDTTFYACMDFVMGILKASKRTNWSDVSNATLWLRDMKPETKEYLKSRHAFEGVM